MARTFRWLGTLAWIGGLVLVLAWIAGRAFTDRWHWSQYCYWLPSLLTFPAAACCAAAGMGVRSLSRGIAGGRRVPGRSELRAGVATILLISGGLVYASVVEWRFLRGSPAESSTRFRVLHWNATGQIGKVWADRIIAQDPDLVVINPASYQPWESMIERYRPFGEPLFRFGFTVFSKYRVVRTALFPLDVSLGAGLDPREGDRVVRRSDPGHVMYFELDTTAVLGRPLIVWCLDLPSDVSLHRRVVTEEAARSLASYPGAVTVVGPDGIWTRTTPEKAGLPRPDIIMGDLNIPRGSGSLDALVSGLDPVYDQAGRGPFGTWPYEVPLWHLDQMFIAPWLRAIDYVPVDLGGGTHRAHRADVTIRDALGR